MTKSQFSEFSSDSTEAEEKTEREQKTEQNSDANCSNGLSHSGNNTTVAEKKTNPKHLITNSSRWKLKRRKCLVKRTTMSEEEDVLGRGPF